MSGVIPSLPQYAFMAWSLVKHRDNFTFTFYLILLDTQNISLTIDPSEEDLDDI
jgi:hypothetical protein